MTQRLANVYRRALQKISGSIFLKTLTCYYSFILLELEPRRFGVLPKFGQLELKFSGLRLMLAEVLMSRSRAKSAPYFRSRYVAGHCCSRRPIPQWRCKHDRDRDEANTKFAKFNPQERSPAKRPQRRDLF